MEVESQTQQQNPSISQDEELQIEALMNLQNFTSAQHLTNGHNQNHAVKLELQPTVPQASTGLPLEMPLQYPTEMLSQISHQQMMAPMGDQMMAQMGDSQLLGQMGDPQQMQQLQAQQLQQLQLQQMQLQQYQQQQMQQQQMQQQLQQQQLQQQQLQQQQLQQQQLMQPQQQLHQQQLLQLQIQQQQQLLHHHQQHQQIPPPQRITDPNQTCIAQPTLDATVPPPEFNQIVYAIAPPLFVYPSMFSPLMYPMMMPDSSFSMGVANSPSAYQGSIPMKIKKSPNSKDSSKKKQTRKTLWIPLSVENIFLTWFEKIGSTQYRCKRDACVGLIEAIASSSGDIEEWIPEAQKAFNEDSKRKGRDLIWDKLNDEGKNFCDEKRTWSLTFSAAVLKYCQPKEPSNY